MKIRLSTGTTNSTRVIPPRSQNRKRNRTTSKLTSRRRVKQTNSSLDSMKTSSHIIQTEGVSNVNSTGTYHQSTISVKSHGLLNPISLPCVDQLSQTMTTDITISTENQFEDLYHSLNPPITQFLDTPISSTKSTPPPLIDKQELVKIVYQQAVVPHIFSINECESRLRLILFDKFAIPIIKNVIDFDLSLYHYNPTFIQLHDIVRLGFKEVGLISH